MLAVVMICVSFNSGFAQGRPQMRRRDSDSSTDQAPAPAKKTKRGARAIGVVEFLPTGKVRLVPVAVWIDGHYYDASLYASDPEPFALQPETVYEAQDYGEPTGLFTVTEPQEVNGSWVAYGQWKPELPMDAKLARDAAKLAASQPKKQASKTVMTGDADEGPPVLRRSGSSESAGNGSPSPSSSGSSPSSSSPAPSTSTSTSGASPAASNGRPTLARPGDEPEPASAPAVSTRPVSSTADDDPDRPTLKADVKAPAPAPASGSSSAPAQQTAVSPASNDSDPNRPVLVRGPQPPSGSASGVASAGGKSSGAKAKPLPKPPSLSPAAAASPATLARERRSYPAISDAGSYEMRPLLYSMSSADRDSATDRLRKMAFDELQQYLKRRNLGGLPKGASLMEFDLRSFDLELSNSATLVFTAKLPALDKKTLHGNEFDYYITLVARQDINGELQKVFSSVTDSNYLDATSRMELVGAVDADANGRGDLLFRQYSDTGISYGLYRVFPYQLQKLFEGGASM